MSWFLTPVSRLRNTRDVVVRRRVRGLAASALVAAAFVLAGHSAGAAVPDYRLGDVATKDVITPIPLLVLNPEATEALKQKIGQQVHFIVRFLPLSGGEAEAELRQSVAAARTAFLNAFQRALNGRIPVETDLASPVFGKTLAEVARDFPKDLPFEKLARAWVRGTGEAALVDSLLQPVRDVMVQPIVASKTDTTFPPGQSVRLIPVRNASESPTAQELESAGTVISSGKVIGLWRARRLVETHFPAGEEGMGRFAAAFVRANSVADPRLTEILRARKMEGVTANDAYEAAQEIVRKGQTIDRKALGALTALRERNLIGTLQTKLDLEQSVSEQISRQTAWIAAGLGILGIAMALIYWRLRARPSSALVPVGGAAPFPEWDPKALPGSSVEGAWQQRAVLAEGKAERAHQAIRSGVLGWMREKIFWTLSSHRAELLSAQRKAEVEMRELEQRLVQLHTPLQERISAYEKRIGELEKDLAAKGEENRELLGARINVAKQQLIMERERRQFGAN